MAISYPEHLLQYDPRTKQQIKEALYSFLYEPAQRQFKTKLDTLIIRNALLGGYSHKSFTYKGKFYTCDNTSPPRKMNRLVPQLVPAMNEFIKELKHLNEIELPYTLGYINQVLNASQDPQDYLRLLPAAVHRPLKQLTLTCPCKARHLTEEDVLNLQEKNKHSIDLIKQRMVKNLIT